MWGLEGLGFRDQGFCSGAGAFQGFQGQKMNCQEPEGPQGGVGHPNTPYSENLCNTGPLTLHNLTVSGVYVCI